MSTKKPAILTDAGFYMLWADYASGAYAELLNTSAKTL
jgi:hypothetical protein